MRNKLVLIVTIMVLLGLGGLVYVNLHQKQENNEQPLPQPVTQSEQEQVSTERPTYDPSEGGKYLVIKEWGVRLKLSNEIRDAKILYFKNTQRPWALTTKTAQTKLGCGDEPLRFINRAKKGEMITQYQTVEQMLNSNPDSLIKIGDYYYVTFNTGAPCSKDSSLHNQEMLIVKALVKSFKTLESY